MFGEGFMELLIVVSCILLIDGSLVFLICGIFGIDDGIIELLVFWFGWNMMGMLFWDVFIVCMLVVEFFLKFLKFSVIV